MSQRRIDVQCLLSFFPLLGLGHIVEGTHVVEPVGQLYKYYPYILGHGKEHFPVILGLYLLLGRI